MRMFGDSKRKFSSIFTSNDGKEKNVKISKHRLFTLYESDIIPEL